MNRTTKALLIFGVILTLGPISVGLVVTVISVLFTFRDLSQQGISEPHQLATDIGFSLTATAIGLVFVPIGFAVLIGAGIVHKVTRPSRKIPPSTP